jgi:hypothetical protein
MLLMHQNYVMGGKINAFGYGSSQIKEMCVLLCSLSYPSNPLPSVGFRSWCCFMISSHVCRFGGPSLTLLPFRNDFVSFLIGWLAWRKCRCTSKMFPFPCALTYMLATHSYISDNAAYCGHTTRTKCHMPIDHEFTIDMSLVDQIYNSDGYHKPPPLPTSLLALRSMVV